MNLRDELAEVFRKYIAEYGLRDVAVSQTAMDLSVAASPFIGRALAAERAAAIDQAMRAVKDVWSSSVSLGRVLAILESLPHHRSALAEAIQERTNQTWQHAIQHAATQEPEGPGCSCELCSSIEVRLAIARREQREKDAKRLEALADSLKAHEDYGPRSLLQRGAAAIREQE